jgi:arylsulfatase A-like enzyme
VGRPARLRAGTLAGILVAGAAPLCAPACRPAQPAAASVPARHVVLVSFDTARADHFGFYGNRVVATPNLDRLAAESVVLDDFMTVVPTTLASHTTLMTGKHPHSHGVPRNGFVVHEDNVMLAEILRDAGFATAGFAGSFALAGRFRFAQGFEHYDETFDRLALTPGGQNERSAEAVTRAVLDYLDRAPAAERRMLFVHYFDAHAPYAAPPPYDTLYDPRGREGLPPHAAVSRDCSARPGRPSEADGRTALQYASEITYLDHHVGVLLDGLRERGILDDALVVVTSDHGENLWEHAVCFDHGWDVFESTLRAVGLLRLPGAARAGTRNAAPASSVDVLPTVLDVLGLPPPAGIDGAAIDLADPGAPGARVRHGQATKPWEAETEPRWRNLTKARCVRQDRFKLVQVPFAGREMLFDLAADPAEQDDLFRRPTPEVAATANRLRGLLEDWAASARPLPSRFDPAQRDETLERLKALGYVEDGPSEPAIPAPGGAPHE